MSRPADPRERARKFQTDRLFKRLRHRVGGAIEDYGLIAAGDRIVVGMSGGKDSYALLDILLSLRQGAPLDFDLLPVHVEAGFPGADCSPMRAYVRTRGLELIVVERPIISLCKEKLPEGEQFCSLCSRLRRGALYETARQLGAVSVALGHHKEDVLATLLLNMGYAGTIKTMPPLLRVDKGDLLLIRPLVRCHEHDLLRLAQLKGYPLLPQGLCGHGHAGARARVREVLAQWERDHPKLTDIMFRSLSHVVPSHLNDRDLYDFAALRATCSAREPALKPDASVLSPKEQQHTES